MHQLETKVRDLSKRLQQAEEQRLMVQNQLVQCNSEKELCLKRLEVVSAAHECRITEMHCVIAELSKKLRSKQENTIMEEQEPEGSGILISLKYYKLFKHSNHSKPFNLICLI